jgi:hypothetical protein
MKVEVRGPDGDPRVGYTLTEFCIEREMYKLYGMALATDAEEAKKSFDTLIAYWYRLPRA